MKLPGIHVPNAILCCADFSYADLRGANFSGADLKVCLFYKLQCFPLPVYRITKGKKNVGVGASGPKPVSHF